MRTLVTRVPKNQIAGDRDCRSGRVQFRVWRRPLRARGPLGARFPICKMAFLVPPPPKRAVTLGHSAEHLRGHHLPASSILCPHFDFVLCSYGHLPPWCGRMHYSSQLLTPPPWGLYAQPRCIT